MSLLDTKIELKGKAFDILLSLYPPIEGTSVYFLQTDGVLKNYKQTDSHAAIISGFRIVTHKYQQTRELQIATSEANFWDLIRKSSHVAIGTYVFEITHGSTFPPSDKYPYYSIQLEGTKETYTP